MRFARFELYVDKAGESRWRFKASNGRVIADSGEGYSTRKKARTAARRTAELMAIEPRVFVERAPS